MRHPFMEALSLDLAGFGVASFRYQFPYMEAGRGRPDPAPRLEATVRAAVAAAHACAPDLPLVAGGKSMGGRMTSRAFAEEALPQVRGLVFVGFPLHPAGKPSVDRADHLGDIAQPMLFLQGTRDRLADLSLLQPVLDSLGARAELHLVTDGDHSFQVLKRTGRSEREVSRELAGTIAGWVDKVLKS